MFSASPVPRSASRLLRSWILTRMLLRTLWLLAACTLPGHSSAAEAYPYTVQINAPAPLDTLLKKNLDLLRFRGNASVDQAQVQRLIRAAPEQITTLLETAGFYTPEISVRLDPGATPPQVLVKVEPGAAVLVGSVELILHGFDSGTAEANARDTEAVRAAWRLPEGQIFRQDDWELAKRTLLRQAAQTRYPRAQLTDSQATVDPASHRASLRVVLESGPALRFGALRIEGLQRYPERIVTELNQIAPGDDYSEAALQAYQARLQDTGYFSSVEVSADPGLESDAAAPQPGQPLPLLVRVTENKTKNVSAGLGFSTNTGKRIQLNYDDLNVFGLKSKNALTMETKQQTARSDLFFPTTGAGYKDSIGARFQHSDIADQITTVTSLDAKRAWGTPILERSLTLEFLNETATVTGAVIPTSKSKSLPLTFSFTRRALDSLLFPSQGYVISAQLGAALLPVLTDEKFVRGMAKFIFYQALGKSNTAILRGEGGALASAKKAGIPTIYLFRAGGDQSVRGYAYQELGVTDGSATVGGRYMATGSAELQHWFNASWGGAIFYDAGNAADSIADWHPKSGYGFGVRYKSPVGPINVDLAYGHAVQKYRLHFSLGFTF